LSARLAGRKLDAMSTILITGANKGLGYESARRLIEAGHDVWMAARDPQRGQAAADALGGRFVQLDVLDDESVAAAAEHVAENGGLDVLVNNAGIVGPLKPIGDVTPADLEATFATNVFAVVRVTQAFLPVLRASDAPVVVNVSSGMGSLAVTGDPTRFEHSLPNITYSPSKAALNMVTTQLAKAIPEVRINAVDPGYTATDFNGGNGHQTVTEGTDAIVAMAQIGADGPTGTYTDREGVLPW
jgi:NAD(P)-dependent dehydrogenase (short-subunit alcohol dehydrogenase family)